MIKNKEMKKIIAKPKDDLERDLKENLEVGDVVTIDDDANTVEVYIVKSIKDNELATICGLQITSARDDVYIEEITIPLKLLIYIGNSFINLNGYLWKVRDKILKGESNLNFHIN